MHSQDSTPRLRGSVPQSCHHCGSGFLAVPYRVAKGQGIFCSRTCCYAWRRDPANFAARFWSYVDKLSSPHGCWLWTGYCQPEGYGKILLNRQPWLTHRYSYTLAHGTIPDGMWVLHNCPGGDNPSCVNPSHLFLGDADTNNKDAARKGRTAKGERHGARKHPERMSRGDRHYLRQRPELVQRGETNGNARLTTPQVTMIRQQHAGGGITYKQLAREYGVSLQMVRQIVLRRAWKHVP